MRVTRPPLARSSTATSSASRSGSCSGTSSIVNPSPEGVVDEAPQASVADVEAAAAAARAALPAWRATAPEERARLLQAVADRVRARQVELLPLIIAETGATLSVGSAL